MVIFASSMFSTFFLEVLALFFLSREKSASPLVDRKAERTVSTHVFNRWPLFNVGHGVRTTPRFFC